MDGVALPRGWLAKNDKDGDFLQYHHGDVVMRADDKGWIVRVGCNTETGRCSGAFEGIIKAEQCLIDRLRASLKPMGLITI